MSLKLHSDPESSSSSRYCGELAHRVSSLFPPLKSLPRPPKNIVINNTVTGFFKIRVLLISTLFLVSMTACETMEPGEPLIPVGDEQPGPGLFTGESGEFKFTPGNNESVNEVPEPKPEIDDLDLQEMSEMLAQKIEELERQKQELEQLKLRVDKKLQD